MTIKQIRFEGAAKQAIAELALLAKPGTLRLSQVVDCIDELETYFSCSAGLVIRVLRSEERQEKSRPAFIQFYAIDGTLIKSVVKHHESSGLFFAQFASDLNHSRIYRLASKPSFISSPNVMDFNDVVPNSPFKTLTAVGGRLNSHDFG